MKHRQSLYTIFLGGILLALSSAVLAQGQHLIGNTAKRLKVEEAFKDKLQLTGQQFYDLQGHTVSTEEEEALEFLYAYMPLADITDYPTTFYLDNVRCAPARRPPGANACPNCCSSISCFRCA